MLAPLDNETIFKKAFTDKEVFQQFIKDLFGIDITVDKIETEKQFSPPISNINFKLDIYAETADHRFVIEIQRIDYDHNFDRFLNYFLCLLIEQQKKGFNYEIPQIVLGVIVLTRPYKLNQLTNAPIRESVMVIDFDPRNLKDERIKLWEHKLLFLNPNPKYKRDDTPANYQDWLDLISASIDQNIDITLNLNNKGIAKTVQLIDLDKIDPDALEELKIDGEKKAYKAFLELESLEKGKKEGIEIGIEKGVDKEKISSAFNGIKAGFPNDIIIVMTGLTNEQIDELRKQTA